MHEIVTIQIGNQANYVGTHFWNAQESYFTYGGEEQSQVDHDVHFKAGIGADGSDTFTPRTIIYDLKSNFGTLRRTNALYDLASNDPTAILSQNGTGASPWTTAPPTLLQHQALIASHPYQIDLNAGVAQPPRPTIDGVRYWSDFNRVFYHPRSLVQIRANSTNLGAQLGSLEDWGTGAELLESLEREDGETVFENYLRPFLEECDQLQGVQVLAGVDDAWGGFTDRVLEELRDDMGKGAVWVWGLEDGRARTVDKVMRQQANITRSFQRLTSQASLYIPLSNITTTQSPEYLHLDTTSTWHTSALQTVIIESITLPSRLRLDNPSHASLSSLESVFLGEAHRNIVEASLSIKKHVQEMPLTNGNQPNGESGDTRMRNGHGEYDDEDHEAVAPLDMSLFQARLPTEITASRAHQNLRNYTFATTHVQRGSWPAPWVNPPQSTRINTTLLNRNLYESSQLFPVPTSFPPLFKDLEDQMDVDAGDDVVPSLAVHASLSATTSIANRLRDLTQYVGRSVLIGRDEREDMYSDLKNLADEYVEGWDAGSDLDSGSEED